MPSIKNVQPPKIIRDSGTHHPINQIKDFILFKLTQMGFQEVYGPEIESEEYNFDMLNKKKLILQGKCMILFIQTKNQLF